MVVDRLLSRTKQVWKTNLQQITTNFTKNNNNNNKNELLYYRMF